MKTQNNRALVMGCHTLRHAAAVGLACWIVSWGSIRGADAIGAYKVQVVHPLKVGDRLHLQRDIDSVETQSTQVDGKAGPAQSSVATVKFSGTLEVLVADRNGEPTRWKVTAETASVRQGSTHHDSLVKPGTEFILESKGGKWTAATYDNRKPLSDEAQKLLPLIFETSGRKGESSLGALIDTPGVVTVGQNWGINAKVAADDLKTFDSKLKPADISGNAKLKAVTGDTKKTLVVEYEFTAKLQDLPDKLAGMTPVVGTREESGTIIIPADLSTGYTSAKSTIRVSETFKQTKTEKKPAKAVKETKQPKPKSKPKPKPQNETVTEETSIVRVTKVNSTLKYERLGNVDLKYESSPMPSASPSPSSSAASSDATAPKPDPN